jgi:hypothetical protein
MGQRIQDRQLKLLEECRAVDRKIAADNRQRVKVGDIVKINTWGAPKARTAIVVRTYKAPDDDTVLVLPDSAAMYEPVKTAIENGTLSQLNQWEIYPQCRTLSCSEWRF